MPCYSPLKAYRGDVNKNGKRPLVFSKSESYNGDEVEIACGQCAGCRLERSRQWAMRIMNESQMHEQNSFITLTYNNENLPYPPSLDTKHYQDFMKRLRKHLDWKKIKYYHCGEYGDETNRPHYHAIIFGHDFSSDRELLKKSFNGDNYYVSEQLQKIWGKGHCIIGDVTFESASYVARYVMKKQTGDSADEHYKITDPDTGEIFDLKPEYSTMSNGIGKSWYEKYKKDIYPHDEVIVRGKPMKPPKYYDTLLERENEDALELVKFEREIKAHTKCDNDYTRLLQRAKFKSAQLNQLKRNKQ
jgi:hypothetical protein